MGRSGICIVVLGLLASQMGVLSLHSDAF